LRAHVPRPLPIVADPVHGDLLIAADSGRVMFFLIRVMRAEARTLQSLQPVHPSFQNTAQAGACLTAIDPGA
jgi:hypothetical protein